MADETPSCSPSEPPELRDGAEEDEVRGARLLVMSPVVGTLPGAVLLDRGTLPDPSLSLIVALGFSPSG